VTTPDRTHAGADVAAALDRLRAVFGPVQILAVRAHDPAGGQPAPPAMVQGRLGFDQEPG
jgi:hypothetical protein